MASMQAWCVCSGGSSILLDGMLLLLLIVWDGGTERNWAMDGRVAQGTSSSISRNSYLFVMNWTEKECSATMLCSELQV